MNWRWVLGLVWAPLIVLWCACLAGSIGFIKAQRDQLEEAQYGPGLNLSACRDFALIDFSTPDLARRAECDRIYEREMGELPAIRQAGRLRIGEGAAGIAGLIVVALASWRLPSRLRPDWRAGVVAVVLGAMLGATYLLFALSGMPHLGVAPTRSREQASPWETCQSSPVPLAVSAFFSGKTRDVPIPRET